MNTNDEFDLMAEQDENSTIGLPRLNFGKCSITSRYVQWQDKTPVEVTAAQFAKLDPKARTQEAIVAIAIQEFNPALQFTYSRKVNVGGLDWNKIFKPSLFKAMGVKASEDKAEQAKQLATALRKLNGAYVSVEDVPQTPTKSKPDSKYNTAKLITVYADRTACYAAWKSVYGGAGTNGQSEVAEAGTMFENGVPEGYTTEGYAEQKKDALNLYTEKYNAVYAAAKGGEAKKIADARKAGIAHAIIEHFGENGATPEQLAELIGV